ncbi:hypothetical protein B0O80DRAFT_475424 [Mortierella sp. GBAus27b]|nr:hypothetical protein B0O80DRAFT_475424 [Mortierella sp. GBAus27b]
MHSLYDGASEWRSLTRVRVNGSIIPQAQEMEFYNTALGMLSTDLMRDPFKKLTDQIRTRFPNAGEWLDWYLHPSLGKLIFSALACHQNSHMSSGTNAQESLGYDFKRNAIRSKLDIPETVEHVYRYATRLTTNWQKMEQNCIMENVRGSPRRSSRTTVAPLTPQRLSFLALEDRLEVETRSPN